MPKSSTSAKLRPRSFRARFLRLHSERLSRPPLEITQPLFYLTLRGSPQFEADLEPTPRRSIQQFGVIARRHYHNVAWQCVYLKQ